MMELDVDRSLAFTALLELYPGFGDMTVDDSQPLVAGLAAAFGENDPPDRFEFARGWISGRAGS